MRMKKITAALFAVSLTFSMGIMVSASDPTPDNNTAQIKATYQEETQTPNVYYVDVEWGSLEYTYKSGKTKEWNPKTLKFTEQSGTPGWMCSDGADTIKVTNHSNTGVTAYFSYEEKNSSGIGGSFSNPFVGLIAPEENSTFESATSGSTTLTLSGSLPDNTSDKSVVGGVTVTIQDGAVVAISSRKWPIYATDTPGVYKAIFQQTIYDASFRFTIDGVIYGTGNDGKLRTDGYCDSISASPGLTYEFILNTNDLTYTKTIKPTE